MQIVGNAFAVIPLVYGIYTAGSIAVTLLGAIGAAALVLLSAALRYDVEASVLR